jgi:hypothetical protein
VKDSRPSGRPGWLLGKPSAAQIGLPTCALILAESATYCDRCRFGAGDRHRTHDTRFRKVGGADLISSLDRVDCVSSVRITRDIILRTSWTACAAHPRQSGFLELLEICKVLAALLRPPIIAGLVFRADEAVGPPATIGRDVQVASRFPDRLLQMLAGHFARLSHPRPAYRIGEKVGKLGAICASACELARPPPVFRCLKRRSDASAEVIEA